MVGVHRNALRRSKSTSSHGKEENVALAPILLATEPDDVGLVAHGEPIKRVLQREIERARIDRHLQLATVRQIEELQPMTRIPFA